MVIWLQRYCFFVAYSNLYHKKILSIFNYLLSKCVIYCYYLKEKL